MSNLYRFVSNYWTKLFPEEALVLRLCFFHIQKDRGVLPSIQALLAKDIHWQKITSLIQDNKLWGSATDWQADLQKYSISLPDSFVLQCRALKELLQYHRSLQKREAAHVFRLLSKNNVHFVVMKSFVASYHSQWRAPKVSADIDILVPYSAFSLAVKSLNALGYKHRSIYHGATPEPASYIDFYSPYSQETFQKGLMCVELHTCIVDTFYFLHSPWSDVVNRMATQELYDGAYGAHFGTVPIRKFSETLLLESLFLHSFFQHNLEGGSQYMEVAALVRQYAHNIDWRHIHRFMERYGMKQYYFWFLCLFDDLFPSILPKNIQREVATRRQQLTIVQVGLYYYMKFKILHRTSFSGHPEREKRKEWCWAIIDKSVLSLIANKIIRRVRIKN